MTDEADSGIVEYDEITLNRIIRAVHKLMTSSSEVVESNVDRAALDAICVTVLRLHEQCPAVDMDWEFGTFLKELRR